MSIRLIKIYSNNIACYSFINWLLYKCMLKESNIFEVFTEQSKKNMLTREGNVGPLCRVLQFWVNWKFIDGFLSGKMHFVKPSNQIV